MDEQAEQQHREWLATLRQLCDYDPVPLAGKPLGMFHCPKCGCMVMAGMPHPPCDPTECGLGSEGDMDSGDPGPR